LYVQLRLVDERLRALDALLGRRYGWLYLEAAPGRRLARVTLLVRLGGDVDVANARPGRGGEVSSTLVLHASDHLELQGLADFTWLDPLFTAGIERLRASYNFTPRAALRLVVQNEHTRRDSALDARLMVSALLTYRWSWASAVYLGLGNDPQQQLFFKVQVARP